MKETVVIAFTRDNRIEIIDMASIEEAIVMVKDIASLAKIEQYFGDEVIAEIFNTRQSTFVEITDELTLNIIFESGEWRINGRESTNCREMCGV